MAWCCTHRMRNITSLRLVIVAVMCFLVADVTTEKNCHTTEIDQTILIEITHNITLHCEHNVTSPAMLTMEVFVPCGDQRAEVFGPVVYRNHELEGHFNISSNISSHIKEKVACCKLSLFEYDGRPSDYQLYNCTLILPVSHGEDNNHSVLPRELVIGVVIGAIVTILLILVLVYIGFNLPWYQRHKTTSEKRDGFDDSDNVALAHSEARQCSEDVKQSDKNHSYTGSVFVGTNYCGNAKKELVCMNTSDAQFVNSVKMKSAQKITFARFLKRPNYYYLDYSRLTRCNNEYFPNRYTSNIALKIRRKISGARLAPVLRFNPGVSEMEFLPPVGRERIGRMGMNVSSFQHFEKLTTHDVDINGPTTSVFSDSYCGRSMGHNDNHRHHLNLQGVIGGGGVGYQFAPQMALSATMDNGGKVSTAIGEKGTDFGRSRNLSDEGDYFFHGRMFPVELKVTDALHYNNYFTASYVVSYGCIISETRSHGHKPFKGYTCTNKQSESPTYVCEHFVNYNPSWNLYASCFPFGLSTALMNMERIVAQASIKEPYKEPYKHGHHLREVMISAALVLLAMADMQMQLQNNNSTQNSYETN